MHEEVQPALAYPIRNSLYVNLTSRCTLACVFCPKIEQRDWWTPPTKLGSPKAFDLITDPKEEFPQTGLRNSWMAGPAMKVVVEFEESLKSGRDLLGEPCFQGNCPNREGHVTVVCPSGFWGFRHDIGMPWPAPGGPEMAKSIAYTGQPQIDIAYYQFEQLGNHLDQLGTLGFQTQRQNALD